MFYPNQKVVYIGMLLTNLNDSPIVYPKHKEEVTIKEYLPNIGAVTIEEYKYNVNDEPQCFFARDFILKETEFNDEIIKKRLDGGHVQKEIGDMCHRLISEFYNEKHDN
jgi:hypothetical protein